MKNFKSENKSFHFEKNIFSIIKINLHKLYSYQEVTIFISNNIII